MKIIKLILVFACLAGTAAATDMALTIKLHGHEIETGQKASPIMLNGFLIIEDINSETNIFNGSFTLMDARWEPADEPIYYWPWGWVWVEYVRYYEDPIDVEVQLILNENRQFGMIVDMEGAVFSGIGHLVMNENGVEQAVISSGNGAFMYTGYHEEPVVTNSLILAEAPVAEDPVMELVMELEVGKMSALLNKSLTDAINDSTDPVSIVEWLESHNVNHRHIEL
jgi:hypothetical protein